MYIFFNNETIFCSHFFSFFFCTLYCCCPYYLVDIHTYIYIPLAKMSVARNSFFVYKQWDMISFFSNNATIFCSHFFSSFFVLYTAAVLTTWYIFTHTTTYHWRTGATVEGLYPPPNPPRPPDRATPPPYSCHRYPRRKNGHRRPTRQAGGVEKCPPGNGLLDLRDGGGSPGRNVFPIFLEKFSSRVFFVSSLWVSICMGGVFLRR